MKKFQEIKKFNKKITRKIKKLNRGNYLHDKTKFQQNQKNQKIIIFYENKPLLTKTYNIEYFDSTKITELEETEPIFIGRHEEEEYFAIEVKELGKGMYKDLKRENFGDLREFFFNSDNQFDANLLSTSKSLLNWRKLNQFCGVCSFKTIYKGIYILFKF
jgi:NADH pyrophosphatase NudC (nudix superfamily)